MTIIAIDHASYCPGPQIAAAIAERTGYPLVGEEEVFSRAARSSGVPAAELGRLVHGPAKLLDGLKDDRARQVAFFRVEMARLLDRDDVVFGGALGYLVPGSVTNVLKVGLVGGRAYRLERATESGLSPKRAEQVIKQHDEYRAQWSDLVLGREPWDKRLFDILLPAESRSAEEAIAFVLEHAAKPAVATSDDSRSALKDFHHAADLQLALARQGFDADVESRGGVVEILIKHHTMFLDRLQQQLVDFARRFPGVLEASARPGPRYKEASIYLNLDAELPSKVLLVDDERAFVETLSRRLQSRKIPSTVAYGGAEALSKIEQEEPDVMVLDLKMPGIDGLEVLRNTKSSNPGTEVIILTAHGSDAEERLAFQLGAFAYLRKPVDIDELTETMRLAYLKVKEHAARD